MIPNSLPMFVQEHYKTITALTPIQQKCVDNGLLLDQNILACAPTASGKTLVGTMAMMSKINKGKVIYIAPLRALAQEKYKSYKKMLEGSEYTCTISTGETESSEYLGKYDLLVLTTEKLDSCIRQGASWINEIACVVIDEIHLLHDNSRGPTLEIILTLLMTLTKTQIVGLSATIGNPAELAQWLNAKLVQDSWRPVTLKKGIYTNNLEFFG